MLRFSTFNVILIVAMAIVVVAVVVIVIHMATVFRERSTSCKVLIELAHAGTHGKAQLSLMMPAPQRQAFGPVAYTLSTLAVRIAKHCRQTYVEKHQNVDCVLPLKPSAQEPDREEGGRWPKNPHERLVCGEARQLAER